MKPIKNRIPNFDSQLQTMKRTLFKFYLFYIFEFKFKMQYTPSSASISIIFNDIIFVNF